MQKIHDNLNYLIEHHKEVYKSYIEYGKTIHETGPIQEKQRWLIKIAVSTSCGHPYAVKTHARKAIKAGCTREEIEHAILLASPTCGFPRSMEALLHIREELDGDCECMENCDCE